MYQSNQENNFKIHSNKRNRRHCSSLQKILASEFYNKECASLAAFSTFSFFMISEVPNEKNRFQPTSVYTATSMQSHPPVAYLGSLAIVNPYLSQHSSKTLPSLSSNQLITIQNFFNTNEGEDKHKSLISQLIHLRIRCRRLQKDTPIIPCIFLAQVLMNLAKVGIAPAISIIK